MISTDRISLFTIASGPRGSCKTLLMTAKVCERLLKSYFLKQTRGIENKIWSNYPVGFNFKSPLENGKRVHLQPLPLNMEAFYTFDDELAHGWVFIDEIDQWYDRQDWQAVTQKLMNKVMTQIRKKRLNVMASIQDINWLNARGQFQSDIIINCREAAFSPWGRRMGLDLGEASFLSFRDKSGVMTGYTYEETGKTYNHTFWGKRFWNYYDTDYQFNPLEAAIKYKLKVPTKVIEVGGGDRLDDVDNVDPLRSGQKDCDFVLLADLVDEFKEQGCQGMRKPEFRRHALERGLLCTTMYSVEKRLAQLGVGIAGREFVFEHTHTKAPATPGNKRRKKELVKV